MLLHSKQKRRRGLTVVESAMVYPLAGGIMLGLVIGAMGVFRFQEMAALAREASRYASVHGAQYRKDAGLVTGTASSGSSLTTATVLGTASPYDVSPWTLILWYPTHPTEASGSRPNEWTDSIYDASIRDKLFMLDPANLECYIGWTQVPNQSTKPDNYPGSRVTVTIKYPVMPEWIWQTNKSSVSTAPMPITN